MMCWGWSLLVTTIQRAVSESFPLFLLFFYLLSSLCKQMVWVSQAFLVYEFSRNSIQYKIYNETDILEINKSLKVYFQFIFPAAVCPSYKWSNELFLIDTGTVRYFDGITDSAKERLIRFHHLLLIAGADFKYCFQQQLSPKNCKP